MNEAKEKPKRDWAKVQRSSNRQVNIRLSADEAAKLDDLLEQAGVSAAGYMKAATFNRPLSNARPRLDVDATLLRQILGQLGKLGSNANQIARAANMANLNTFREVQQSLATIEGHLSAMRSELLSALHIEP